MKGLKILTVGVMIWAITLVWPEINEIVGLQLMLLSTGGLALLVLGRLVLNHLQGDAVQERAGKVERSFRPPHDSRPIKPIGLA